MPAVGREPGLNLVLFPHFDPNVGILGFNAHLRLARQVVGFGPIVGVSKGSTSGGGYQLCGNQEVQTNSCPEGVSRIRGTRRPRESDVIVAFWLGKFLDKSTARILSGGGIECRVSNAWRPK
jgi:hypothetical protein